MRIRNKKNALNVLAYRSGVVIVKERIPGGSTVSVPNLTEFSQIVNKADFNNRGWFEIISEENNNADSQVFQHDEIKQVEEYAEEKKKTKQ